jgi:deazaflavin-dependent oxidoreductase (nitroreductase family)
MPLPRALARSNRRFLNRFMRRVAGRLPGFATVIHHGRISGREYRTPVNAFRREDGGYTIALTYGARSDWVENVLVAGGCVLEAEGRRLAMTSPRIARDASRRSVPAPVRVVLGLLDVDLFLQLDRIPRNARRFSSTSHGPMID